LICKVLKQLSNNLLPYREAVGEVIRVIGETHKATNLNKVRILKHLLPYAENQFGHRVPEKAYRERGDFERIDNYTVEIDMFIMILDGLVTWTLADKSLSLIQQNDMTLSYHEKILHLLKPWSACLDVDTASQAIRLDKDQIKRILQLLLDTEKYMARIYTSRTQFDLAESHCERALSYARRYEGEGAKKTFLLCRAFQTYSDMRKMQGNYVDGVLFAEEAYNCVAIAYNPVHSEVQRAAGGLIELLILNGDLYDAERYAQLTLDSSKDPANKLDQEIEEVAVGYYNLGHVIFEQKGDLIKAEKLVRESLRIRVLIHGKDHFHTGHSTGLLANLLQCQDKLGDETKELHERSLAIDIRNGGPESYNTAVRNGKLGDFHQLLGNKQLGYESKNEHLRLSKAYFSEAVRIFEILFGLDHPYTIRYIIKLSEISGLSEAKDSSTA
jgi:tetratricopeptide (TPR) repeat protein